MKPRLADLIYRGKILLKRSDVVPVHALTRQPNNLTTQQRPTIDCHRLSRLLREQFL